MSSQTCPRLQRAPSVLSKLGERLRKQLAQRVSPDEQEKDLPWNKNTPTPYVGADSSPSRREPKDARVCLTVVRAALQTGESGSLMVLPGMSAFPQCSWCTLLKGWVTRSAVRPEMGGTDSEVSGRQPTTGSRPRRPRGRARGWKLRGPAGP